MHNPLSPAVKKDVSNCRETFSLRVADEEPGSEELGSYSEVRASLLRPRGGRIPSQVEVVPCSSSEALVFADDFKVEAVCICYL